MYLFWIISLIFYFINKSASYFTYKCDAPEGKCPGSMNSDFFRKITIKENSSLIVENCKRCEFMCYERAWCHMAQCIKNSNSSLSECKLYESKSYRDSSEQGHPVYLWTCCDIPDLCKPVSGRCKGIWYQRQNIRLKSTRDPIKTAIVSNVDDCISRCLKYPMSRVCGSVNFRDKKCEMLFKWHNEGAHLEKDTGSLHLEWHCCNVTEDLDHTCKDKINSCKGKWEPGETLIPQKNAKYIGGVYVMGAEACREECRMQPACVTPMFNNNISLCLLQTNLSNSCFDNNTETEKFQTYIWSCCPKQKHLQKLTSPVLDQTSSDCIRITNVSDVTVVVDNCTTPLVNKGREVFDGMAYTNLNYVVNINRKIWRQIYNGYENLWYHLTNENSMQACAQYHCELYSGCVNTEQLPRFVNRTEWLARDGPSKYKLQLPVQWVLISNRYRYFPCGCYTTEVCSEIVRFQQAMDIRNSIGEILDNFLVDLDGVIYEGTGWEFSALKKCYELQNALQISIIGKFSENAPTIRALTAIKQLIYYGIERGYISTNYHLRGVRQICCSDKTPQKSLYDIIHNYANFNKNESIKGCYVKERLFLIIGTVSGAICLTVIIGILLVLKRKDKFHGEGCRILRRTYRFYRKKRGGVRVRLIPLGKMRHSPEWQCINFMKIEGNPDSVQFLLDNHEVYLLTRKRKCLLGSTCRNHISRLAEFAKVSECSFFTGMLNNCDLLNACSEKTCIVLMCPSDRLEARYIVVCHLESAEAIRTAVEALRSNKCICRDYKIIRECFKFFDIEQKRWPITQGQGSTNPSPKMLDIYMAKRQRYLRIKRWREITYRAFGCDNLNYYLGGRPDVG